MIHGAAVRAALLAAAWTQPVERGWLPWFTLEIVMMTRASSPEMAKEKP